MDRERVIVYIDENTDDGMMWEELNQEGKMQVSVYDEEFEYDVEYHHSIVVKSLQEHLADHDKQLTEQICNEIREKLNKVERPKNYPELDCEYGFDTCIYAIEYILNEIEQGETK